MKFLAWEELKIYDCLIKKIIDKIEKQTKKNTDDISNIGNVVNVNISVEKPDDQSIGDIWVVETERK